MRNEKTRRQSKATTLQACQARPTEEQITARALAILKETGGTPRHYWESRMQAEAELLRQCRRQIARLTR